MFVCISLFFSMLVFTLLFGISLYNIVIDKELSIVDYYQLIVYYILSNIVGATFVVVLYRYLSQ